MTAPTLLDYAESTFSGTGSSETTDDLDWAASGDKVIALGATEDNSETISTPTATGLTFAALTGLPTNTGSSCKAYGWQATASGDGNSTIAATTSIGIAAGISAWAFSGVGGIENPVVNVGTGLTVSMTIVGPDSTVCMVLADWNASTDVTVTTTPAGGTVREITNVAGRATFAMVEWSNQAAGTRSYGLANWTGTGTVSKAAVEVKGTAGGGATDLVIADATQAQAVDSPALTQQHVLVVADAAQGQTADSPTLTQQHVLAIADAAQAQVADSPTLAQVHALVIADAAQGQVADSPTLTQVHALVIADAVQAQLADSPTLNSGAALVIADAAQAQSADSPTLGQVHNLTVIDATQAQLADSPTLTQQHVLAIADAVQQQRADNVVLLVGALPRGPRSVMIDGQARYVSVGAQTERVRVTSQAGEVSA